MNVFSPFFVESLNIYWPIMAEGILVSVALGLIGCFLVVRGLSLLGDALSHSVLPGIVIGFLIGGTLHSPWILFGATAVGMLAAVLVQAVQSQSRVKEDASLGIIFTTMFAIGVVMINLFAGQADLDPGCVLYGNIEYFVSINGEVPGAIWPMAAILAGIIVGLLVFYRQLLVSTFDPGLAVSLGIPAAIIHYILMGVLSLTVVASFEAVGAILAVALLIMPGATARLWTDRMPSMLLLAAAHGIISTILGYWLSHPAILDTSASGSICVAGFGLFMGSWLLSPRHGVIMQALVRRRLTRKITLENLLKVLAEFADRSGTASVKESDLSKELGMSSRAFHTSLQHAVDRGWVQRQDGQLTLTASGQNHSRRLVRAHLLWEEYLQQQVGVAADHVHDAAEWIEHHLDEDRLEHLDELLGRPLEKSK